MENIFKLGEKIKTVGYYFFNFVDEDYFLEWKWILN